MLRDERDSNSGLWCGVRPRIRRLPPHPWLAGPLDALADLAHDRGAYPEALRLRQRALAVAERALAPDDAELADVRAGLGSDLLALDRHDEAAGHLERAIAVLGGPAALSQGYRDHAPRLWLAHVRIGQGRTADAVALLEVLVASATDDPATRSGTSVRSVDILRRPTR